MYRAFYEADAAAFPMSFEAVVTYIWLQQAFLAVFGAWIMEGEIFDAIRNGNIAYELCRPVSIYQMWFSRSVANRVSKALLRCVPILAVAALLPAPYGLRFPVSWAHGGLFLLTLLLGLLVIVAFTMLVYITTFYTISPEGVRIFCVSAVEFFCRGRDSAALFPGKNSICPGTAALCGHAECASADLQRQYVEGRDAASGLPAGILAGCDGGGGAESVPEGGEKSDSAGRLI